MSTPESCIHFFLSILEHKKNPTSKLYEEMFIFLFKRFSFDEISVDRASQLYDELYKIYQHAHRNHSLNLNIYCDLFATLKQLRLNSDRVQRVYSLFKCFSNLIPSSGVMTKQDIKTIHIALENYVDFIDNHDDVINEKFGLLVQIRDDYTKIGCEPSRKMYHDLLLYAAQQNPNPPWIVVKSIFEAAFLKHRAYFELDESIAREEKLKRQFIIKLEAYGVLRPEDSQKLKQAVSKIEDSLSIKNEEQRQWIGIILMDLIHMMLYLDDTLKDSPVLYDAELTRIQLMLEENNWISVSELYFFAYIKALNARLQLGILSPEGALNDVKKIISATKDRLHLRTVWAEDATSLNELFYIFGMNMIKKDMTYTDMVECFSAEDQSYLKEKEATFVKFHKVLSQFHGCINNKVIEQSMDDDILVASYSQLKNAFYKKMHQALIYCEDASFNHELIVISLNLFFELQSIAVNKKNHIGMLSKTLQTYIVRMNEDLVAALRKHDYQEILDIQQAFVHKKFHSFILSSGMNKIEYLPEPSKQVQEEASSVCIEAQELSTDVVLEDDMYSSDWTIVQHRKRKFESLRKNNHQDGYNPLVILEDNVWAQSWSVIDSRLDTFKTLQRTAHIKNIELKKQLQTIWGQLYQNKYDMALQSIERMMCHPSFRMISNMYRKEYFFAKLVCLFSLKSYQETEHLLTEFVINESNQNNRLSKKQKFTICRYKAICAVKSHRYSEAVQHYDRLLSEFGDCIKFPHQILLHKAYCQMKMNDDNNLKFEDTSETQSLTQEESVGSDLISPNMMIPETILSDSPYFYDLRPASLNDAFFGAIVIDKYTQEEKRANATQAIYGRYGNPREHSFFAEFNAYRKRARWVEALALEVPKTSEYDYCKQQTVFMPRLEDDFIDAQFMPK